MTLGYVFYSSLTAADAVADGSVTNNPVFNHGFSPMFDRNASLDDQLRFTSTQHFSNAFKRITRQTPALYRSRSFGKVKLG